MNTTWTTMTPADKVEAARIMYGTNSPKHLMAIRKFLTARTTNSDAEQFTN